MMTRWRCTSKLEQEAGAWIVRLRPLHPRRSALTAIPTGRDPGRGITPLASFEFTTSVPDVWTVGKDYEMRITAR
jgi:hypothetical protein